MSILTSVQDFYDDVAEHKEKIGPKLETLAGAWPPGKVFVGPKKQMLRLLKGWNMKIEFCINTKGQAANGTEIANGVTNGTNNSQKKNKKKKKHKTQERLKEEKEMKMKMAKEQENSDIPSFSTLVSDNINNEENTLNEKLKRKGNDEEEAPPVKAKKKKKSSK